ncbi:hypothetical protein JHW45_00235 [Paracoccus stylophorae]|uniref:Uncharacterized protein n=1 Tax=Paracoccus stylophorae TaxID=659350 RepID=A0ABY7SV32_9RHOB|nr:hypothetical protein [Paracoccus stylophorae]WCR10892.1 hypothetical protein JHW45_00235 [Paracoccus stylophorae]
MAYLGKYETPDDLLKDDSLSDDRKIEMLEQWRDDKRAYIRATEEGMTGNDSSEFLRQIKKALMSLDRNSAS